VAEHLEALLDDCPWPDQNVIDYIFGSMSYRIENAKTGRSSCRQCGLTIEKDTLRWGSDDGVTSRWIHLTCAVSARPRGFKPFAEEAARMLAAAKPAAAKPAKKSGRRNEALEAAIVKDRNDKAAIGVLADWLQAEGDPWGELIALELAEDETRAGKILRANQAELTGGFAPKFFGWRDGLISVAGLEAKAPAQMIALMDGVFQLRTAFALERLQLPIAPTREIMAAVARAPRTLRSLFIWAGGTGLGALAHPTLQRLEIFSSPKSDVELVDLFRASGLPSLKRFEWFSRQPLRASSVQALLDSPLLPRLEVIELNEFALDEEGSRVVLQHVDRLKHLRALKLEPSRGTAAAVRNALKKPLDAWDRVNDADEG
jgi:uncharacterized protein (TIGR02996 family)